MIKVKIDYATKSSKYPRLSKVLEFNDEKHLENYINKANREGKKIIGTEILSSPCVYYLDAEDWVGDGLPSDDYLYEHGRKMTIEEFQQAFNFPEEFGGVSQVNGYIVFKNIK